MKLKLISLCLVGAICVANAQNSASSQASAYSRQGAGGASSSSNESVNDQLRAAKDALAMLQLKYQDSHPEVIAAKRRINDLEKPRAAASSAVRYGTRLNSIVRRGNPTAPGSIILTSPLEPEKYNELTQDLNVLTLIINRNLDRVFGQKSTEYRLGVPITMAANRSIETTYIEDYGLLFRIHVPFPVASSGEREKKPEPAAAPDTEWEKARRALYAGEADPTGNPNGLPGNDPAAAAPAFDQSLVDQMKKEIVDALKNVVNVRNMRANEAVTVAVIGAADHMPPSIDPLTGLPTNPNANRPTVLTIRVQKADSGDDLAKNAKFATYFDTPVTPPPGGGYGGGGLFGTGYSYQTVPDGRR